MAYVDGFKHDIFISYARVDDLTATTGAEGWVTTFERHLKIALDQRVGRIGVVKIWRDLRQIHGNQVIDRTLEDALSDCAVFLALTSTGYLESDYCRQELGLFHDSASSGSLGLTVGDRRRILHAQLVNVPRRDRPAPFEGTLGFPFHDAEGEDERGEPSEPESKLFKQQLRPLAEALHQTLTSIKTSSQPADKTAPLDRSSCTVFLADVTDSLRKNRRRLAEDLGQHKIRVLANTPPPFAAGDHERRVSETLRQADLSVHLVNGVAGREIEGDEDQTYDQRQIDMAIKHGGSQMIWVPKDLKIEDIEDEGHRRFLQELERGQDGRHTYDFVRAGRAEITRHVLEKIEQVRAASEVDVAREGCLLLHHKKDTAYMLPIAQVLVERGIEPYIRQETNEPQDVVTLFRKRLRQVKSLILVYGRVSGEWVHHRLDTAAKQAVTDGRWDLKLGVFAAPPEKPPDEMNFDRELVRVRLLTSPTDALAFLGAS